MAELSVIQRLASAPGEVSRAEAIAAITSLFLTSPTEPSERERHAFSDIIAKMIAGAAAELSADISAKLASTDRITHELAVELSESDLDIAERILRNSPLLSDEDLIRLSRERTVRHRLAIANRSTLSEQVTETLVDVGEHIVLRSMAANDGAAFSSDTMRDLVTKAGHDPHVQKSLARRSADNRLFGLALEAALTEELKVKLGTSLNLVNAERLESTIRLATTRAEEEIKGRMKERVALKVAISEINLRNQTANSVVATLAIERRLTDIATLISELLNLPKVVGMDAFRRDDHTSLAVLCRGLLIEPDTYASIIEARCELKRIPKPALATIMEEYESIPPHLAMRSIRILKIQHRNVLR